MYDNKLKKILATIAFAAVCAPSVFAIQQVGMTINAADFTQNISAKAYDRTTGTFYVASDTANDSNTFTSAGPTVTNFTSLVPTGAAADFVVYANAGILTADYFNQFLPTSLMSLINGTSSNWLPALQNTGGATGNPTLSVFNGTTAAARQTLAAAFTNANNAAMTDPISATSVNRLAAGTATVNDVKTGKAFAYVVTSQTAPGAQYDGVCSANIDLGTGAPTATAGSSGLGKAQPLNAVTGITAAGSYLGYRAAGAGVATTNGGWVNDLYWDNELSVLYAGVSTWIEGSDGNISNGLVMTTLDEDTGAVGAFTRADGTSSTNGPAAVTATNNELQPTVFAAKQSGTSWANGAATIVRKIRGMHTSTDFKYLILDSVVTSTGGRGDLRDVITNVNTVWAVRVAQTANATTTPAIAVGQVVKNIQSTPGTDDVLGNAWTYIDLGATLVGAGPLPFDYTGNQFVTDMEVIGDAVYASVGSRATTAGVRSATNDIGVFASRALFDNNGTIQGWTPWERVFASNYNVTSATALNLDTTSFFEVDGERGIIWQVVKDATALPRIVTQTDWSVPAIGDGTWAKGGLPGRLNTDLADGCTAILDLPTGTPGIGTGANASNSFALFGGNEQVVFAQTKYLAANSVVHNFSDAATPIDYLLTDLPDGAGYVRSLGYSRGFEAAKGYFFAGTDNGLYVLVPAVGTAVGGQAGFDGNTGLTNLTAAPFSSTPGWLQMPTLTGETNPITGSVVAIEANGAYLFVVEQQPSGTDGFVSKLHRFTIGTTNNGTANVTNHIVIAQSGVGTIPDNAIFTGFTIVSSTGVRASGDWGLLTTNGGFFISEDVLGTVTATSDWTAIDSTRAYTLLKPIKRIPSIFPTGQDDGVALGATIAAFASEHNNNIWQKSALFNTGLLTTIDTDDNEILPFNSGTQATAPLLGGTGKGYVDFTNNFWTDGGRRIFGAFDSREAELKFESYPFFTSEWNMTRPFDIAGNNSLSGFTNIICIENISGLGLLIAGTDKGVIALG